MTSQKYSFINNDICIVKNFLNSTLKAPKCTSEDNLQFSEVRDSIDRQLTGKVQPDPDSSFRHLESTPKEQALTDKSMVSYQ